MRLFLKVKQLSYQQVLAGETLEFQEAEFRNKGIAYCAHCDGPLFAGKHVAVIGGGNSGVEAAIDLAGIVKEVTLFGLFRD